MLDSLAGELFPQFRLDPDVRILGNFHLRSRRWVRTVVKKFERYGLPHTVQCLSVHLLIPRPRVPRSRADRMPYLRVYAVCNRPGHYPGHLQPIQG